MTRLAKTARWLILFSLLPLAGCTCLTSMGRPYIPSSCDTGWDPVLGSCSDCGVCGGDCQGHTPATYLKSKLTCGSGCGEIYWGEWLSDPPDDCDPCDDCGNWVGPRCCEPGFLERMADCWCSLWGFRVGGCSTCATLEAPCSDCVGTGVQKGGYIMESAPMKVVPQGSEGESILTPPPISSPSDQSTTPADNSGPRSILRSVRFK